MAKRKRKRSHSASPRVHRAVKTARRRRSKRRSGGLSEMFSKTGAMHAAKDMVGGAIGGALVVPIEKGIGMAVPGTNGKMVSSLVTIGLSFVAHTMLKQPAVSAGMMGAKAAEWARTIPGLSEADFADDDALMDEAEFMDEDGNLLDENGDVLLSADELSAQSAELSAAYDNGWYQPQDY